MARFKETVKNIVIALLLCSILCLTLMALPTRLLEGLPRPVLQALGIETAAEPAPIPVRDVTAAGMPLSISVSHGGGRATVRRSAAQLEEAYGRLSPYLGQALASAGEPRQTDEAKLTAALEHGALFSFGGSIPARALCLWLTGETCTPDADASDFLLAVNGKQVDLYLAGEKLFVCKTALSAGALQSAAALFTPDGTRFAPEESGLHPLTLWEQDVSLPTWTAQNPVTANYATTLAVALGLNPYDSAYTDPAGNTVFTETHWSLAVNADGLVTVTVTDSDVARFTAAEDAPTAKIELVRSVLAALTAQLEGQQQLQLLSVSGNAITFTYVLEGVPVLPAACAAEFDGKNMTRLTLQLRSYQPAGGTYTLMPVSAAASISPKGSRLQAAYSLSADCGWTAG